jgi:hypothetical protein
MQMKKQVLFGFIITAVFLSLVTGLGLAQKAQPEQAEASNAATPGTAPWFVGWADKTTSTDVGSHPAIAYSPLDDLPYVSYYDAANGNLMLVSPLKLGGNCGDGNLWWCRVVDGDGLEGRSDADVGKYSSIAFWKSASIISWKLGITYYDGTNNAVKYAVYSKVGINPASWHIATIRSASLPGSGAGTYTTLKYASDGKPQIGYYSWLLGNGYLNYAYPVSSGGNCGEGADAGKWHCETVDSGPGVGKYASLDLNYEGQVYFAYYDGGNGDLKTAYYGGIGTCGTANAWICSTVDGTGANVGLSAALSAPRSSADPFRIAYYDSTNGKLKYATSASGGNCGGGAWQCDNVDSIGAGLTQAGISMALDGNGNPIVAYEDASDDQGPSVLKIARPAWAVGLLIGNCGDVPPGFLFQAWQCETVDSAAYGVGYVSVAAYTSVAVNENGLGAIAYFETDDYYLRNSLKVAYQNLRTFLPFITR